MICDDANVKSNLCDKKDLGTWILAPNATEESKNLILTKSIHLNDAAPINYPITKTGYYCVAAYGFNVDDFKAVVEFREAYGELPATQIPKLPFYGGISVLYAVVVVYVANYAERVARPTLTQLSDSGVSYTTSTDMTSVRYSQCIDGGLC